MHEAVPTIEVSDSIMVSVVAQVALFKITSVSGLTQLKNVGSAQENCRILENALRVFILLHEKFLQFDWLRAVVFQLNLKYLHVKITNLLQVEV